MEMKTLRALLPGMMSLIVALAPTIAMFSSNVSAAEFNGTSPPFAPGTSWLLDLGTYGQGYIVEWDWTTSDDLSFFLTLNGYPFVKYNHDGFVTWTTGDWGLKWYNNNWFFSATVSYSVVVFEPWTTITMPSEGAYVNSKTISVQGTADSYATGVLVGPDEFHLKVSGWSGDSWKADGVALSEGQDTILVRTYYWLDNNGYNVVTYDQTIHVVVDTIPPELLIERPLSDTYVKGDLNIEWQCSDTNGVVKTEIKFDAWGWQEVAGTSFQASLADGAHTVQVRVSDPAGNQATGTATFTADSTPPALTIFSPTEGSTTSDKRVVFGGTDNLGITEYMVNLDSSGWQPALTGTVYDLDLTDGAHTVQVKLTDRALNEVVRTVNFILDTESPTMSITGPAVGSDIRGGYVDVTWQCADNIGIASIEMKIDGWDWQPVTGSEFRDLWLPSGYHVIQIRVADYAGNQAIGSTSFNNDNRALSFGGPYYGLPTVGIVLAVVVAAVIAFILLRKKRGGPAVASVPKEEPVAQAP